MGYKILFLYYFSYYHIVLLNRIFCHRMQIKIMDTVYMYLLVNYFIIIEKINSELALVRKKKMKNSVSNKF